MTLDGKAAQESRSPKVLHGALLLLALILLVAGFPFFVFGLFLAVSQANGLEGDLVLRFCFGGGLSVGCAMGISA